MARKTLKEKILSDNRHLYKFEKLETLHPSASKVSAGTRTILLGDLRKTITITATIFALQLILFYLLRQHLVNLSWISY